MEHATVLSSSSNQAVVHLSGRAFPGSVIQGDSLAILYGLACELEDRIASIPNDDLRVVASELRELLGGRLRHYDYVLSQHGYSRPYATPQWKDQT